MEEERTPSETPKSCLQTAGQQRPAARGHVHLLGGPFPRRPAGSAPARRTVAVCTGMERYKLSPASPLPALTGHTRAAPGPRPGPSAAPPRLGARGPRRAKAPVPSPRDPPPQPTGPAQPEAEPNLRAPAVRTVSISSIPASLTTTSETPESWRKRRAGRRNLPPLQKKKKKSAERPRLSVQVRLSAAARPPTFLSAGCRARADAAGPDDSELTLSAGGERPGDLGGAQGPSPRGGGTGERRGPTARLRAPTGGGARPRIPRRMETGREPAEPFRELLRL